MHSLLKLKKGDRIDLFIKEGTLHENDDYHKIHFTGKLLFEGETNTSQQKTTTRSPVYFVLQKSDDFSNSKSVIPFEVESLNIGESIDTKKQVFTTPAAGIYEFIVKGYKTVAGDILNISLRVNGKAVATSWADYVGIHDFHTSFSIYCILQIKNEDRIDLFLEDGPLHGDINHYTTFTGKLLFKMDQPGTLSEKLADKCFANFSLFQSLPDAWGIGQVFPVMPLAGLDRPLSRRGILMDITCDSDGQVEHYVDGLGVESTLPMPVYGENEECHVGFFLVGAYQEILFKIPATRVLPRYSLLRFVGFST